MIREEVSKSKILGFKGKFDKIEISRRIDRAEEIWNGNLYKRLYMIS